MFRPTIVRWKLVFAPWFAVECALHAPVAQLDRASAFGAEGWEFESLRAHQSFPADTTDLEGAAAAAAEAASRESAAAAESATAASPSRSR
jgi:hypothetical protein